MNERSFIFATAVRTRNEEKEQLVRQKTVELVARYGLEGLSMHKLAKAAGVAAATLYIYFTDREDLLVQVCAEVTNRLLDTSLQGLTPDMSFAAGLRLQWRNRLAHYRQFPEEVAFTEHLRYSPYYQKVLPLLVEQHADRLGAFMTRAAAAGEVAPMPFELYWAVAFAPLYQLLRFDQQPQAGYSGQFVVSDTLLEQALRMVVQAVKP